MIKHVDKYTIGNVFSEDMNLIYEIPKYQREYCWGKKHIQQLFNDVADNENGYFLGSVIGVDTSNSMFGIRVMQVIDGQQRLTSLSILFLALYKRLLFYKEQLDENQITDLNNLKRKIVINKAKMPRVVPQSQNNNKEDYYSLFGEAELIDAYEKRNNAGNRRIYKAYELFDSFIESYIDDKMEESGIYKEASSDGKNIKKKNKKTIEILLELIDRFSLAIVVLIEVDSLKDAYMLFESLNNRGTPLTSVDLIKNSLIYTSDKSCKDSKEKDEIDKTHKKWEKVIDNLGEDDAIRERFFRQYYNAFVDDLNKPFHNGGRQKYELGPIATRTNLLDIYEKLIKKDYKKLLDDLLIKSELYSIIINNTSGKKVDKELESAFLELERISGAPSYILLLFLLSKKEELKINKAILLKIIDVLVKFFVRRNITDIPATRNLIRLFMEITEKIRNLSGYAVYSTIHTLLKEKSADNTTFKEKLSGNIYKENPEATRFILCYYEDSFDTDEIHTDLWEKENNKFIWTIEHVFPEGDNINLDWIKMIANENEQLAIQLRDEYTHKLGNLTITAYNSNLSNMSFDKKKTRKDKNGKYIGYKNRLRINDSIVNKKKWTVDCIKKRTTELVEYAMRRYNL